MPDAGWPLSADVDVVALAAELDPRDVAEPHDASRPRCVLSDDVAELLRRLQPRLRGDRRVELLRRRRRAARRSARPRPGCSAPAIAVADVGRHQLVAASLYGVEPDAHRVLRAEHLHVADARRRGASGSCRLRREIVGDVDAVDVLGRRRRSPTIMQEVALRLRDRDALLLHGLRQPRQSPAAPCSGPAPARCRDRCPASKVTVMLRLPDELLVDAKYSRPSMPVSCCSMTCVTLFSTRLGRGAGIGRAEC